MKNLGTKKNCSRGHVFYKSKDEPVCPMCWPGRKGKVEVEKYIANAPKDTQTKLKQLRTLIKSAAPKATEKLSYGMPYYDYFGRLAYFRLARKHVGLYIPPPIIQNHAEELKKYVTAKATVQFPLSDKLPAALIKKLVKARAVWNEKKAKK